jgi:outer membrane protein assembly factor BamB/tetratricopeptide (TPR) repeat protein
MARTLRILIFAVPALTIVSSGRGLHGQGIAPLRLETAGDDDRKLLRQIDQMAADGQYDEAVGRLRQLAEERGDALVGVGRRSDDRAGFQRYLPLRTLCDLRLAAWATTQPEALALYRRRVDPLAQRWYAEAVDARDEDQLLRLTQQMLMSSYGDDALLRLGDMHLQQGRYRAARACWEKLSPTLRSSAAVQAFPPAVAGGPLWLALRGVDWSAEGEQIAEKINSARISVSAAAYPDTDLPLSEIRARLVLASILEGSFDRAEVELILFRQLHGQAQGTLAGRTGPLSQLLAEMLQQAQSWSNGAGRADWPTFAKTQQRDGVADRSVDPPGAPTWRYKLPRLTRRIAFPSLTAVRPETESVPMLGYFPIVVDNAVYLSGAERIWGWQLDSGRPLTSLGGPDEALPIVLPTRVVMPQPTEPPMDYCLASDGRRLIVRLGPSPDRDPSEKRIKKQRSFLAVVDFRTYKLLFDPIYPGDDEGEFEGTAVLDEGNLYVLMRKMEPGSSVNLFVACYDLRNGAPRWRRWLCGSSNRDLLADIPPALLTLSGDTLLVNSNLGCVAAVSTRDGRPLWALEYPPATKVHREPEAVPRAPNPCLLHRGTVLAAPADFDGVLALDATTGEVIWTTRLPAEEAPQLLGVGQGNVLVGGRSLRWIDFHDGRLLAQFPDMGVQEPTVARAQPSGYGRGVLAGGLVYWPTRDKIYVFQQGLAAGDVGPRIVAAGEIDLAVRGVTGGNLLVAQDVLLLTTDDHLYAFADVAR